MKNPGVRTTVLACTALIAIVMAMFLFKINRAPLVSDDALRGNGVVLLPRPRDISPFEFIDAKGKPFTNANINGQWSLVYFGYTYCPDACPTTLRDLSKALPAVRKALADQNVKSNVQVVFISVDPERDTTARIDEYLHFFAPDFVGATSTREKLASMATQVNVTFGKIPGTTPDSYAVDHPINLVLINPNGHYQGFLRPPFTAARLTIGLPGAIGRF